MQHYQSKAAKPPPTHMHLGRYDTCEMEGAKLRQLEKQFKVRVKTGCETCRIRRVKCDETKPECTRCTKTGRKCEGYKHVINMKSGFSAAAASYRNSSFLVVPQKPRQPCALRSPSLSLSPDPMENRSFQYFQTHTLPRWTEFFDSELWSQKVLQLSHTEPAIKHGVLALSTMHERFECTSPALSARTRDFAFVQYMQAVKHSNDLLNARQQDGVNLEKVLMACIIFTCYENLAGNFKAANMHLQNGMRILNQYKRNSAQMTASQDSVSDVLYRFDLQAMTFSDEASPYDYAFDRPPECPKIPKAYTSNSAARTDLVGLLRCVMWAWGVSDDHQESEHPTWFHLYSQLIMSVEKWETTFRNYQQNIPQHEQGEPKIYAGNILLQIYAVMSRIVLGAIAGMRTEMTWDGFVGSFRTLVDLAEILPTSGPNPSPSSRSSSSPGLGRSPPAKNFPIAPSPDTAPSSVPLVASTTVFRLDEAPQVDPAQGQYRINVNSMPERAPLSFSPSFELSPIVPLFFTACRCRDPIIRRRAIALLLNCRRREGIWDSLGAGLVAAEWLKMEECIELAEMPPDNWIPLTRGCQESKHVAERSRVQNVHIEVNLVKGRIDLSYSRVDGGEWKEQRNLNEEGFVIGDFGAPPSVRA